MTRILLKYFSIILILFFSIQAKKLYATEFSDYSFLIAEGNPSNLSISSFWEFLASDKFSGVEIRVEEENNHIIIPGSGLDFHSFLDKLNGIFTENTTKVIPVFLKFSGNISVLDSVINESSISSEIFYLPQGEPWPLLEYLT